MADGIHIEFTGLQEAQEVFSPATVMKAARTSLSRIGTGVKTETARAISERWNITQEYIRSDLRIDPVKDAGDGIIGIDIVGRGLGIPLSEYNPHAVTKSRLVRRKGQLVNVLVRGDVTASIKRGSGPKVIPAKYGNRVFIQTMKSGHTGVWVRKTAGRSPIEQLMGPGVGGAMKTQVIQESINVYVAARWPDEFNKNLGRYMGLKG